MAIIGAGGIGATLNTAFDRYEFDTAAAIIITIILILVLEKTALEARIEALEAKLAAAEANRGGEG